MSMFLGEFECKLDVKGRVNFPSALRKQLPQAAGERLVVNRGFEKCLVLYPKNEWDLITAELAKQNAYMAKTREFIRYFTRGATELVLDGSGRILLPKPLQEYAGLKTDIILSTQLNKIEIWSKETYDQLLSNEPDDFARLAEEVMGNRPGQPEQRRDNG